MLIYRRNKLKLFNYVNLNKNIILFIILLVVFLGLRLPLIFNHFHHSDDYLMSKTYPIFSRVIGEIVGSFKLDYISQRYISRLTTLFLSLIGLFSSLYICKRILNFNHGVVFLIGLLIATSQMCIIYSVQASPYGYGPLSFNMIIIALFVYIKNKKNKIFFCSLILSTSIYLQYSVIYLMPAFYLTILIYENFKFSIKNFFWVLAFPSLNVLLVYFFQIRAIKKYSTGWNVGDKSQFLFEESGLFDTFYFYSKNFILLFENNIAFYSSFNDLNSAYYIFASFIVLTIFFIGLFKIYRYNYFLFIFTLNSLITFFVFVFIGIVPFSPTRHHLCFMSLFVIIIGYFFNRSFKYRIDFLTLACSIMIVLISSLSYVEFYQSRKDNFSEKILSDYISKHNIDYVLSYGESQDVYKYSLVKNIRTPFVFEKWISSNNKKEKNFFLLYASHRYSVPGVGITGFKSVYPDLTKNMVSYKLVDTFFLSSETEVGRNRSCKNGTNGCYLTLIDAKFVF